MSEIIFLHGWAMSGEVFIRQRQTTGAQRIVTPALNGTRPGQIADLLSCCDCDSPILAGWSMGVSLILAELNSIRSRISGLIFISGTPCFIAQEDFPYGMRPAIARRLYWDLEKDFISSWEGFTELLTHSEVLDESTKIELTSLFAKVKCRLQPEQALADLDWLYHGDYRERLQEIEIPVMIISGSQDRICSPDASRYMAERISGSSLHSIKGAGHMPFFTRAEEVNRLIKEFADGH